MQMMIKIKFIVKKINYIDKLNKRKENKIKTKKE